MKRTLISLALVAILVSPALAETLDTSDRNRAFDNVDIDITTVVKDSGLRGVVVDNPISAYGARAEEGSAAANNGSSAYVDNRVFLRDSALSRNELKGHISGNAVHMDDSKFVAVNKIEKGSFKETRGVSLVSQNSGQNSLIQQNFSIQSNLKVDHRRSP